MEQTVSLLDNLSLGRGQSESDTGIAAESRDTSSHHQLDQHSHDTANDGNKKLSSDNGSGENDQPNDFHDGITKLPIRVPTSDPLYPSDPFHPDDDDSDDYESEDASYSSSSIDADDYGIPNPPPNIDELKWRYEHEINPPSRNYITSYYHHPSLDHNAFDAEYLSHNSIKKQHRDLWPLGHPYWRGCGVGGMTVRADLLCSRLPDPMKGVVMSQREAVYWQGYKDGFRRGVKKMMK
ncbi:hypothetical protein ABW21_db0209707 [Orbilia brochopaga]|nr:hypothetical protein ABW21_db0209707 [Drechslerella brochopaga]